MNNPVNKTEHVDDHIADPEDIPGKPTGEESGKEEKGLGAESEQDWITIPFRQPIYSSEKGPRFPQELLERICGFLWDEPLVLVSCTRVCCTLYHAARRVLSGPGIIWRTREALQDYAHLLISHRNTSYCKHFKYLWIYDDASKPFAHVWPMFIPGWMLSEVSHVHLNELDWSNKTPHDIFFAHLSSYTSVSSLDLCNCRFRSLTDLRRVINALPNLTSLDLVNVTLQHQAPRPQLITDYVAFRARSHKLEYIGLVGPTPRYLDLSSQCRGVMVFECPILLRMVAANSSTVTSLALGLRIFASLSTLRQYLAPFCSLSSFRALYQFTSSPIFTCEEAIPVPMEDTYTRSWSSFTLMDVPDRSALQLLQLLATPLSCSKLVNFSISFVGRPSTALLSSTSRVLQLSGPTLRKLSWHISVVLDLEVTPSLAGSTSLRTLAVVLRDIAPSPQKIQSALSAVLSDVASTDLQRVELSLTLAQLKVLSQSWHGPPPAVLGTAESIPAFHTILTRDIFNGLPRPRADDTGVLVDVDVKNIQDNPTAVATIKAHMVTMFSPWLARGILQLSLRSHFDYLEIITSLTSELREDTLSYHGGENVEENKLVATVSVPSLEA
ncbi:uncharacterized protein C8Q71DRAFT_861502 [Rhodofomes roseus]|uniref:F-box domain-containing protein n=1 Tax=Rhodofomes roseus TaxID=34475 RepID=A0ABQ8K4I5_9APHY|nr:uncharacterized protein C8Q71DRAFT_861502 [Rhodofomes roseus]KAH9831829.1 hypothetical protein C8Q71DRAFT_861502 [Rhodofomes roseus]